MRKLVTLHGRHDMDIGWQTDRKAFEMCHRICVDMIRALLTCITQHLSLQNASPLLLMANK